MQLHIFYHKQTGRLLMLLACIASVAACRSPSPRKNEISRLDLATTPCNGQCPQVAIHIDSNLSYTYYGGHYATLQGYYTGHISRSYWDTLNNRLEQLNYKRQDTVENSIIYDVQQGEIYIAWNGHRRHIRRYLGVVTLNSLNQRHQNAFAALMTAIADSSYRHVKLKVYPGKLNFITNYQEGWKYALPPVAKGLKY